MQRKYLLCLFFLLWASINVAIMTQQKGVFGEVEIKKTQGKFDPNLAQPKTYEQEKGKDSRDNVMLAGTLGWTTIMTQGFEGAWPASGWTIYSMSGYADANWKDVYCLQGPSSQYTGYCAGAGANSVNCNTTGYNYPNNMYNYCIYGPFNLSDATNAKITFYYKCWTESTHDKFFYWASANGIDYDGYYITGVQSSWTQITFDLSSYCGDNSVYFAFSFTSDGSVTNKGAFVDDIVLEKFTGPSLLNCIADVENIKINGTTVSANGSIDVTLNSLEETFSVALRGENDGTDASPQAFNNLTLSFPQFTSSSDKSRINPDYSGSSSDLNFAEYYGTEAEGCDGNAEFVITEGVASNGWNPAVSKTAMFNIKPKQWGQFVIYYRMALARDASWSNMNFDPVEGCTTSGTRDCLGYACYKITVNVIQATQNGNLVVTLKNANGTSVPLPGSNGKIQLFQNNGTYITEATTNASGSATFGDLAYGLYDLCFYHVNTGTIHGEEDWGFLDATSHSSNPTNLSFTRDLPYFTGNYRIYHNITNQDVTGQTVATGTPLRIVLEIINPNAMPLWIKARLVFDRDKQTPYDGDYLSTAIQLAGNNTVGTLTFNYAPTQPGDWYGTVGTLYSKNGTYFLSDGSKWPNSSSDKWLNVSANAGSLVVKMFNNDGTSTPYPGSNGKIRIYSQSGTLLGESTTTSEGSAIFFDLPYGLHTFKFDHLVPTGTTIFGPEHWGSTEFNFTQNSVLNFTRKMPVILEYKLFNQSTGQQIQGGSDVPLGTNIRIDVKIKNNVASTVSSKVRLVLDPEKLTPYVFDQTSNPVSVVANGETTVSFNYQPTNLGDYFGVIATLTEINSDYIVTHGLAWGSSPGDKWFKIINGATTYSISGTVKYANTLTTPLQSVTVALKQNGNTIQTTQTNTSGQYTFSNVAPGSYTITCTSTAPWGGVAGSDAQLVQRYLVGQVPITDPLVLKAADVTSDGSIFASDAQSIRRRVAYLINSFPAGDWCFENPSVIINSQSIVQNIRGIYYGDVNCNWVPTFQIFTNPINQNNKIGE